MAPTLKVPPNPHIPLSQNLRYDITNTLLKTSTIPTLQNTFLATCQETGWMDAVRKRVLQLIRGGEYETYAEVVEKVIQEAKVWGDAQQKASERDLSGLSGTESIDAIGKGLNRAGKDSSPKMKVDIRIPNKVASEGVRIVREALDKVVKIEEQHEE